LQSITAAKSYLQDKAILKLEPFGLALYSYLIFSEWFATEDEAKNYKLVTS